MNKYGAAGIPFLFIIDFEKKRPIIMREEEWRKSHVSFHIGEMAAYEEATKQVRIPDTVELKTFPVDFTTYQHAFDYVVGEIGQGNSYLVNLTYSTPIELNLSLQQVYAASSARYKLYYQDQFVCFSPESFVSIQDGHISTFPMKGTIDAQTPNARERILADKKEFAEHVTVVDLLRNDLSMIAEKVQVKRFRYIEELATTGKTLLQVSSHIEGELADNYASRLGDIILDMLPAGSISGAPKAKTLEIIRHAESHERGYYTGVMGYFDGKNLDSGVMIRFIERVGDGLVYKSGGGITYQSQAELEYQEMIDKVYVPISRKHRRQGETISSSLLA